MHKNPPTTKQWKKLFDLADIIAELEPWKVLPEYLVFGVHLAEKNINGYVGFIGAMGDTFGVTVYMGESALRKVKFISCPETLLEIPILSVTFDPPELLEDYDRKLIKSLKRNCKADDIIPVFRINKPGYYPWVLNKKEADQMITLLEQSIVVIRRGELKHLHDLHSDEGSCLYRTVQENGKWTDTVDKIPKNPGKSNPVIQNSILKNLSKLPVVIETIQAGLFVLPTAIGEEGKRPALAYLLLLADAKSGMVLGHDAFSATSAKPSILDRLFTMLIDSKIRPMNLAIHQDGRLSDILYESGSLRLPVQMVEEETLDVLETALHSLFSSLEDTEDDDDSGLF